MEAEIDLLLDDAAKTADDPYRAAAALGERLLRETAGRGGLGRSAPGAPRSAAGDGARPLSGRNPRPGAGHGTAMNSRPRIGFVGVGRMGASMALNLRDAGYPIAAVYDSNEPLAHQVASGVGAAVPRSLAGVTAHSDVVVTVVSDDAAMDRIFALSETRC